MAAAMARLSVTIGFQVIRSSNPYSARITADAVTVASGWPTAKYLLSGGAARCSNCGGPLSVAPDNQGRKR